MFMLAHLDPNTLIQPIMTHSVYLSIGSNIGDLLDNCCRAIEALQSDPDIRVVERSAFYRSAPVDFTDQEWFLNAALKLQTTLPPALLLQRMQAVQHRLGRKSDTVRFGPRIIDLDIIFYADLVLETAELILPHPRMHKRRFVLQPICDIDPSIVHPLLGVSVQKLLNQLVINDQEIEKCSYDC
jgi:2-amino-4-hydroxy-6-hydroxymethyldihydropteridine diphosphokinase